MKRFPAALVLVFAAVSAAGADPPALKLPAEVKGEASDFIPVVAETDGKAVRFVALDPGLKVFPAELLASPKTTVVAARAPGRYRLLAYTGNADGPSQPAFCTVVVTDGTGPPPPDPPPPAPDALTRQLQAAYDADAGPDKRERMAAFVGVMDEAARMAADLKYTTNAELVKAIKEATTAKVADSLSGVRAEVGRYLNAKLPAGVVPLDATRRPAFVEHYSAVAKSSKAVKR